MKKIIILIIFIFILSGCYDYVELTSLSIITTITIDKKDDNFITNIEVLNNQKEDVNKSIIISGKGKTISSALNNTFKSTPKEPYLAHLKIIVISESVIKDDLKEVMEYFLRSPNVRNEFYLVLYKDGLAKDVYDIQSDEIPVVSDYLKETIDHNNNSSNNISIKNFEAILIEIFEKGKDSLIPVIYKRDNTITMYGNALLDDYKEKVIIGYNDSLTYNILDNKANNATYLLSCPDLSNNINLTIYDAKTSYKLKNNILYIDVILNTQIDEYNCSLDLKQSSNIKILNDYYSGVFKNKINNFYHIIKENNSDVLGIGKIIYNQRRIYKEDDWLDIDYKVNIDFKINKEGLIFGVENGN